MDDVGALRLTRAQRSLLEQARAQTWVRVEDANDVRCRDALVRRGLLERHPHYVGGTIYRLTAAGREALR